MQLKYKLLQSWVAEISYAIAICSKRFVDTEWAQQCKSLVCLGSCRHSASGLYAENNR